MLKNLLFRQIETHNVNSMMQVKYDVLLYTILIKLVDHNDRLQHQAVHKVQSPLKMRATGF